MTSVLRVVINSSLVSMAGETHVCSGLSEAHLLQGRGRARAGRENRVTRFYQEAPDLYPLSLRPVRDSDPVCCGEKEL